MVAGQGILRNYGRNNNSPGTGSENTVSGAGALTYNTTGSYNAANGARSLIANTTGNANTASGFQALKFNTTGGFNTASGGGALTYNTSGSYNTALGYIAGPDATQTGLTNATAIGARAVVGESNALVLGSSTA
jgi:trimeric autotransporter adhesin